jgi:non-specific serine/threonine protein kinase
VGKTRLAIACGHELATGFDAAFFVDLAPLSDPALVTGYLAAALGIREEPESAAPTVLEALFDRLSSQAILLILDNCEHLLQAVCEVVDTLLARCSGLHVLATSRQRLRLVGEVVCRIPSLPFPGPFAEGEDPLSLVMPYPSVRLFLERAQAARPGFVLRGRDDALAVGQICRRLDGIPLALELAAARASLLPLPEIARRLDDRFRLLTGGSRAALPRQQTLWAAIDWSYTLLPEAERWLFRNLAVFSGGCTLESLEAVRSDAGAPACEELDLLDALIDRSIVLVEEIDAGLRFRMPETVREYARERLRAQGEEEAARLRHLHYFLRFAEEFAMRMSGPGQAELLSRVESELDNLRTALETARNLDSPLPYLRLVAALTPLWALHGLFSEGWEHARVALEMSAGLAVPERARALAAAARLAIKLRDGEGARTLGEEGAELFRRLDDVGGRAGALNFTGVACLLTGDLAHARACFREALECAQAAGDRAECWMALLQMARVARDEGRLDAAEALCQQSLEHAQEVGGELALAESQHTLAVLQLRSGHRAEARDLLERSLQIDRHLGRRDAIVHDLERLAEIALQEGDQPRAAEMLAEASALWNALGMRPWIAPNIAGDAIPAQAPSC